MVNVAGDGIGAGIAINRECRSNFAAGENFLDDILRVEGRRPNVQPCSWDCPAASREDSR